MADIKALLKEARKLVDDGNFKDAQECCKTILRKDKQNYLALVLLGKSFEQSDQAPLAFQKAISSKSDNPLAWFGLANYYEKLDTAESQIKCIKVYEEILKLKIETERVVEILSKVVNNCMLTQNSYGISIIIQFIKETNDNQAKANAQQLLLQLLQSKVVCKDDDIGDCLQSLSQYYEENANSAVENIIAQLTLQNEKIDFAVNSALKLSFFTTNDVVKEMTCEKIVKFYIENNTFDGLDIDSLIHRIKGGVGNCKQAKLLDSIILYDKGLYLDAYKDTIKLINFHQPSVVEGRFLLNCAVKLKNWNMIEKLSQIFLDKIVDNNFHQELKIISFESFVKQKKWFEAFDTICSVSVEALTPHHKAYLVECFLELGKDVNDLLDSLKDTEYYKWLMCLQYLKRKKYHDVITKLEYAELNNPLCLFYLGIAYFETKQYDKSLPNLLKAAKIDKNNADVFLYLGHYYRHAINDFEKARKCYEKGLNLRVFDNETTKCLSEVYKTLGKVDQDFELLSKYSDAKQSNESWLRFRLGLHYLNRREWESAISNFRLVIKEDRKNPMALECLADAYYGRGAHMSALRAYSLVMLLDPKREYHCQMRIGYIHSLLTQYAEALVAFQKVLIIRPQCVLALKGISETFIRIAKKKASAKLYGSARDSAQQAVNYLSLALIEQKQYTCLWKLLGDVLIFLTKLPNQFCFVYMKGNFNQLTNDIQKNKIDIFPQAIACFSHVSKSKGEIASYDLALAYYAYYKESLNYTHCHVSVNLTIACLKRNPESWRNWTLLGKLFFILRKYNISQHCFVKALLTTKNWAVAKIWCNLGSLYVNLNLNKLANYCFWRGQSTLPSYPHSWIGQGLIAEAIREEEAMDLFRHASRLGYHRESALGYADWVCRTLRNVKGHKDNEFKYVIEGLHAVPYAIDLMEWFLCHEPNNACALTILGILQERYGLLTAALKTFEKAYKHAAIDKRNITILNMARIHLRIGNYEESIKYYKAITEASFDSACGLALALYKNNLYEESYSAYDTALHWLSNEDDEKADLLVAMAGIVYKFKGPEDAKTLLFHSIQVSQKKPTARSLFGICCLGLLHSDPSLSKLALSELRKYEDNREFGFHITFLKSYILFCEGSPKEALTILSESLHEYPNDAALWYLLSQYLIKIDDLNGARASICAQKALCSTSCVKQWEPPKAMATASIAEYVASHQKKAIKLAKVGYHVYPDNSDILAALIFTLVSNNTKANVKCFVIKVIKYMRRFLTPTKVIIRWLNLLEKKLYVA